MNLFVRTDINVAMLRFMAFVPPNTLGEVGRFHTSVDHLRRTIDVLCRNLDYYPEKARKS